MLFGVVSQIMATAAGLQQEYYSPPGAPNGAAVGAVNASSPSSTTSNGSLRGLRGGQQNFPQQQLPPSFYHTSPQGSRYLARW